MLGWLLSRQAAVAIEKLDAGATGADKSFYEGKIAGGVVLHQERVLPMLTSTRSIIENPTTR